MACRSNGDGLMRKLCRLWCAFALMFGTPAFADEILAVTPSGAAETIFPGKPAATIGQLSSKCIDVRWTVISSSSTELVCEAPLNMGQSIIGQMLMGNSYSTPPRRFFRFNVAEVSRVSRVQASGWMELQMAFGQMKRTDFSGAEFQNSIMSFMVAAGGKLPVGTTFPNHAALGIQADDVAQGKFIVLKITSVETGSAAAQAGLQVGDIVSKIAGKQFKNLDEYLDATAKAARTPVYEVEFARGGTPMKVSVARAFRPTATEAVAAVAEPPTSSATAITSAPSIADELTKLVKLKEAGVLTAAEFDSQKKRLLGQ